MKDKTTEYWKSLPDQEKIRLLQLACDNHWKSLCVAWSERDKILDAIGALTDGDNKLSCINPGPERDELQKIYDEFRKEED